MAEELLIRIGVEDKNASAQIRALQTNIRSLDNQLKLAGTSGKLMGASLSQLSGHYTLLNTKMANMQTQLRSYKRRLSEANQNIQRQQSLMKELAASGQQNTTAYQRAASELSRYKQEAQKAENGIAELELKIKNLNQEIAKTETLMKNHSMLKFGQHCQQLGSSLQDAGVKIQNLGRGIETIGRTILTLATPFTLISAGAAAAAIAYEDAFAGVRKTVDATETQFSELSDAIRNMSKEMPTSANEIAAVAEAAGQLGVSIESIEGFTKVMVMLGDTTNVSCTDAATAFAKFMNVTGHTDSTTKEYVDTVEKLGSVLVHLGNNTATTENDILRMATRLASTGHQVGLSEQQILALSAALSSVGLEAEMGGSAFSKLMVKMQVACEAGGDDLEAFAKICGMTGDQFKQSFQEDAYNAIMYFVQGLAKGGEQGESAIKMLTDMGIEEVRLRDAILRATNANELFTNVLDLANTAFEENNALQNEAAKRYETVKSQLEMLKNKIYDLGITLGEKMLPHIENFIDKAEGLVEWFGNLDDSTQRWILSLGVWLPIIGLGVTALGKLTKGVGSVVTGVGSFIELLGNWAVKQATTTTATVATTEALSGMAVGTSAASSGLTSVGTAAAGTSTVISGLAVAAVAAVAAIAAIGIAWYNNEQKCKEGAKQLYEAGLAAEDLTGKVKGTNNVLDAMFGHEYDIKFSDSYKTATAEVEKNVQDWANRLKELQQEINNILNNTEIDQDTKNQQVKDVVQPWIDEINQGTETINANQEEMLKSIEQYAADTYGRGSKSYEKYMNSYNDFASNYRTVYEQDQQELLSIYEKLSTGELELTEYTQQRIMDLKADMAEAEKNLQMTNAEDYNNQLELNFEKEKALYLDRVENITKLTKQRADAEKEAARASADAAIEQADQWRMAGAISQETYNQMIEDITRKEAAEIAAANVSANAFGAMALHSQQFAEEHGLHIEKVEGDIEGLYEVYDSNGNKMNTVFAETTAALQRYATEHGYSTSTITNAHGAMTKVVVDENNNIIAQLADNEWAWKNNASAVVNALQTEINSVKNGERTTSSAMEVIKAKLKTGEIAASDFGFTSEEAFLACAEEALNCGGDVESLKRSCDKLPKNVSINVTDNGSAQQTQWKIDGIHGKTVTVTVNQVAGTVVQHTKGGSWTINEQGTHGSVGAEQLARVNEKVRGSRSWELVDGPATYLGTDSISDKFILGQGATVKSNTTSTELMMKAVQDEVQRQIANTYFDYGMSSSNLSKMAFNFGNPQQNITNNTNFDDNNIVDALYKVLGAIMGIDLNPTISLNPKQLAKQITPYVDKEMQWRSRKR